MFLDDVSSEVLAVLIESTCLLLKSKAREVVQSALSLLKVVLSAFPDTTMAQFLQDIVRILKHNLNGVFSPFTSYKYKITSLPG